MYTTVDLDKYVLRADAMNWTIFEQRIVQSGENTGKVYEWPLGYYPTLESALRALAELALKQQGAVSLPELIKQVVQLREELREAYGTQI